MCASSRSDVVDRLEIISHEQAQVTSFAEDVQAGLSRSPKSLPCRHIYDEEGSQLFEQICEQPEYYLTRAESDILRRQADGIADTLPSDTTLVELGSGNSVKTRLLIEALIRKQGELTYVPIDISSEILVESTEALLADYEELQAVAIVGDYTDGVRHVHEDLHGPKCVAWLGSSIGNLESGHACAFLKNLAMGLNADDRLLVGMDLKKDPEVLEQAYDDSQGIGRRFNENILIRMNEELEANFSLEKFEYQARYNPDHGRIEMSQRSLCDQTVSIPALDMEVDFAEGELIHVESSHKYSIDDIEDLAAECGLVIEDQWFDPARRFSLNCFAQRVSIA